MVYFRAFALAGARMELPNPSLHAVATALTGAANTAFVVSGYRPKLKSRLLRYGGFANARTLWRTERGDAYRERVDLLKMIPNSKEVTGV